MSKSVITKTELKDQNNQFVKHELSFNKHFLPSAGVLKAYQNIDPNIIVWLMNDSTVEQNARIEFTKKGQEIILSELNQNKIIKKKSLTFAFIILILGMSFSVVILYLKLIITGTIFGATSLFLAVYGFLNFGNKHK